MPKFFWGTGSFTEILRVLRQIFFQIVPYIIVCTHCRIPRGPGHMLCHKSLKLPGSRCVWTLWGWRFIPQIDSNSGDTCKRDNLSAQKLYFDIQWREQNEHYTVYTPGPITTHGSHWPWKVLAIECFLEKCLFFQSALKMRNFPWKVLENDFMVLKNISTRKSNLLVLFCTIKLRKVAQLSNFVIKSPSLLIQWAVFFTVQITKSIFFIKLFVAVYIIEI